MKKFYFAVAASLFLSVSCFASSISLGTGCPGLACPAQPPRATSPFTLTNSTNLTEFRFPTSLSTTNLSSSLSTAENLFSQHTAPLPLAPTPASSDSSLAIDTAVPEFTHKSKGATPTAEPSSLLFLAVGLLFLPLLRKKHAARKSLRLRMA